ncbi:MAG: thiol:disulfide interchange protein DsbA/DsbL [Castellaniella sp.]
MPSFHPFLALFALITGLLLTPFTPAQAADPSYRTLKAAQPSETTGKIEVLEFFAYTCPHCKTMEPLVSRWARTLPEDVVLQRVPVAFNAGMEDLQKLYYTLENLDRLDLHEAFFKAIHNEHREIFTAPAIIDWAVEQGLDRQVFTDVFSSFGIQARVGRANELARNYEIDGTPSYAVGGRFVTSPAQAKGYDASLKVAGELIAMARDRGQP